MSDTVERPGRLKNTLMVAALAAGLSAGAYGIADAANGSGSTAATSSAATAVQPVATTTPAPPAGGTTQASNAQQPWGGQRSDETPLTGDTATEVKEAALAKLPGADVIRVETDADGKAAYEAHVVTADGAPATVFVGKDFAVVSVEQR